MSGSQDCTIKTWTLPSKFNDDVTTLHSKFTEKAHDKDINAICVSPNDKLIATGIFPLYVKHLETLKYWDHILWTPNM